MCGRCLPVDSACEEERKVRSSRRRACVEGTTGTLVPVATFLERIIVRDSVAFITLLYTMQSRSLWASSDICLRCEWRLASRSQRSVRLHATRTSSSAIKLPRTLPRRAFHTSSSVQPQRQPLGSRLLTAYSVHSLLSNPRPSISPLTLYTLLDRHRYQFAITLGSGKINMEGPA